MYVSQSQLLKELYNTLQSKLKQRFPVPVKSAFQLKKTTSCLDQNL